MRKLITLFGLFLGLGIAHAQDKNPTFDETVNYIIQNTKGKVMYPGELDAYSRVEGYHLKDVKIEKNGKIELITNQEKKSNGYNNNFSVTFNIFDLVEKVDYPDGIRAHKFLVHFNGLNVSSGYGITYATDADAQKVARAFRHLKTLCVKENDLFSQIPEEEKKTKLSKEETINYINQTLSKVGEFFTSAKYFYYTKDNYKKEYSKGTCEYNLGSLSYNNSSKTYDFSFNTYAHWENGTSVTPWVTSYTKISLKNVKINFINSNISREASKYGYTEDKLTNYIKIDLSEKCQYKSTNRYNSPDFTSTDAVIIYFPMDDTQTMNRIKNAFERLIELESDEKDPFDDSIFK